MECFKLAEFPEKKYYIFGKEGGKRFAEEIGVPLLGQIPLVQSICESGDSGNPVAMLDDSSAVSLAFRQLAESVAQQIAIRNASLDPTQIVEIKS